MPTRRLTRREFLVRSAQVGAGLAVAGRVGAAGIASAGVPALERPYVAAMHVHASFSEGIASMERQLWRADHAGVDVLWWTEHDWRMAAVGHRKEYHFTSLTKESDGTGNAGWKALKSEIPGATAELAAPPVPSGDPIGTNAFRFDGRSSTAGFMRHSSELKSKGTNRSYKASMSADPSLAISVYPQNVSPDAFLEIRITCSAHLPDPDPVTTLPMEGPFTLSYRIGGPHPAGTRTRDGVQGIVALPFTDDTWTRYTLDLADDLAACFADIPGFVAADNSLGRIVLGVQSRNDARAVGYFDHLDWDYGKNGRSNAEFFADQLEVQRAIGDGYAPRWPDVTTHVGTEVSFWTPHLNHFGGTPELWNYPANSPTKSNPEVIDDLVDAIHAQGGLASYNHVFGPATTKAVADGGESRRAGLAATLIEANAYGADLLEVGYRQRGKADLTRHLQVWDACSRNSVWLTGTGVSDDHTGGPWLDGFPNNFFTHIWGDVSAGPTEPVLLAGLESGKVFFADPRRFGTDPARTLDLTTDTGARMGQIVENAPATVGVTIVATDLPSNWSARLIQGAIDDAYASNGNADPKYGTPVDLAGTIFSGGSHTETVTVQPGAAWDGSFIRAEIRDQDGLPVALSNPIWLYAGDAPKAVPPPRTP